VDNFRWCLDAFTLVAPFSLRHFRNFSGKLRNTLFTFTKAVVMGGTMNGTPLGGFDIGSLVEINSAFRLSIRDQGLFL
jgi:hypothetical protein